MLPAVAQGAIGVEIRADDDRIAALLAPLNDAPTAEQVTAERACLEVLDGSCRTPIAALAEHEPGGILRLRALIALPDGSEMHRAEQRGPARPGDGLGPCRGRSSARRGRPRFCRDMEVACLFR